MDNPEGFQLLSKWFEVMRATLEKPIYETQHIRGPSDDVFDDALAEYRKMGGNLNTIDPSWWKRYPYVAEKLHQGPATTT